TLILDGTSMAAPHVSGAAALLMARHVELQSQPRRIKEILCSTATDLGRERYFQGHGLWMFSAPCNQCRASKCSVWKRSRPNMGIVSSYIGETTTITGWLSSTAGRIPYTGSFSSRDYRSLPNSVERESWS